MDQLSSNFLDELRTRFERSFYFACVSVFESQFPSSWLSPDVHLPLCNMISDYERNTRCAVILPRDWLKSQICSVYYPMWRAMQDPNFTSMVVQNTFTNATKKLAAGRTVLKTNRTLQQLYPDRMLNSSCKVSAEAISLPREAPLSDETFEAAGVDTDVTGRHLKLIVEDDTIAPEYNRMTGDVYEPSAAQTEKVIGFFRSLHFLLQDLEHSQRLVVGTRWRQRDLFSWIQEEGLPFKFYIRAVRENALGEPDPEGELTYPERFSEEVLAEIYKTVGDYMFNALMMSTPLVGKDMLFKESDILEYEEAPRDLYVFTTVDPAPQDSKSADPDYNVVLTAGVSATGQGVYVLDYFRERCNPGELIDEIFGQVSRYKPLNVGVETVAYQKTLKWWIEEQQNKRHHWFTIDDLKTSYSSKPARIRGLQPVVAARQLHIRPHMTALRQELVSWPRGAHDDVIDALAYQLEYWQHAEELLEEAKNDVNDRFSGAQVLEELFGRVGRKEGYPYDLMGVTKDGKDLFNAPAGLLTESFVIGGGQNYSVFVA